MTGRYEGAARGRGHLRAAHADREQVVAALKAAFVQGRLDKEELDARVGQAFAARTYAELAALTADLPSVPAGPAPESATIGPVSATLPGQPARTMARAATRSVICLLLTVALVEGAVLTQSFGLLVLAALGLMATSGFLGYGVVDACQERRDLRQPPRADQRGRGGRDGRGRSGGPGLEGGRPGLSGRDPASPDVRADGTGAEVRAWRAGHRWRHPSGQGTPVPRGIAAVPGPA